MLCPVYFPLICTTISILSFKGTSTGASYIQSKMFYMEVLINADKNGACRKSELYMLCE